MSTDDISLQDLIFEIKRELLTPNPTAKAKDPYPLFIIEKIELEVSVKVSRTREGAAKLTVLDFIDISGGQAVSRDQGHVIKVVLAPLVPLSEMAAEAVSDTRTRQAIVNDLRKAIIKGSNELGGEKE